MRELIQQIKRHWSARPWLRHAAAVGTTVALTSGLLAACAPGDIVGNAPVPSNLNNPAATHTPDGAIAAYHGTLAQFRTAFGGGDGLDYVVVAGLLTDELQDGTAVGSADPFTEVSPVDVRALPEYADSGQTYAGVYSSLQQVRGQAREALGLLHDYAPDASPALRGHLYALMGYSEVFLAELFCSGIPLSTLDYGGDYTLEPGSSTTEVLRHAAALFDTALVLSGDSARVLNLAHVGQARALLDLGEFQEAAAALASVPDGYRYTVTYTAVVGADATNFAQSPSIDGRLWDLTVSDREGINGLDFRSSGDPRTAASALGSNQFGVTLYHPDKYASDGSGSIVLADWVEARLIEAEVALQAGDVNTWLAKLNHLRETAITPALADTTDPGDPDARVDLMFRERAFWLFLTGHRQGDLRRLIRQYGRIAEQVYPTGSYPVSGWYYGSDVTVPIPTAERAANPLFTGCQSRGA